jgi:hypothetical protein
MSHSRKGSLSLVSESKDPITESVDSRGDPKRNQAYIQKFNLPPGEVLIKGERYRYQHVYSHSHSVFSSTVETEHFASRTIVCLPQLVLLLLQHLWHQNHGISIITIVLHSTLIYNTLHYMFHIIKLHLQLTTFTFIWM